MTATKKTNQGTAETHFMMYILITCNMSGKKYILIIVEL